MTPRLTKRQTVLAAILVLGVPALLILFMWAMQRAQDRHPAHAGTPIYITAMDGRQLRIDAGWVP